MKTLIALTGAGLLTAACTTTGNVERNVAGGAAVGAAIGGTAGAIDGCRQDGGCGAAAPIKRQYYDEVAGRYYYYDQASGRYVWEDGRHRN